VDKFEAAPGAAPEDTMARLSRERAEKILRGELSPISPEVSKRVQEMFGRAEDVATENLMRFGEDLASARGLRVSDSPVGHELLRQKAGLSKDIAAAKAAAEIDLGQAQQQFEESVRQFQEGIKQQAFTNRLIISGRATGGSPYAGAPTVSTSPLTSGNLGGNISTQVAQFLAALNQRSKGTTTDTTQGVGVKDWLGPLASLGGAGIGAWGTLSAGSAGLAAVPAAALLSSARFKKDIEPFDPDEYDRALDKLKDTPVTRWKYRWEGPERRPHVGPILELSPDDIKADDLHLDLVSYNGMTHAALKAVDRKVDRLVADFIALTEERHGH
jgi:hypothetical protein